MRSNICRLLSGLLLPVLGVGVGRVYADAPRTEDDYPSGYLFAYFEGNGDPALQEHLRFAISEDGVTWKALNNNLPVVLSDTVSSTGGIRDPHILRAETGTEFLMVATDMNTARDGWEDPNPGIVMMRSSNLVDWSATAINLSSMYPEKFAEAFWVWAPQTIYDPERQKYMVYFSLRRKGPDARLMTYRAYSNNDFTGFEGEPELLFSTSNGCIDNDIMYADGVYHLFFKGSTVNSEGREVKSGIRQAVATSLSGPWTEVEGYVDPYAGTPAVEGSGIFKLNDGTGYVLMYDVYQNGRYEYITTEDLMHFGPPQEFVKDFNPRHGTVLPIRKSEMERLKTRWP